MNEENTFRILCYGDSNTWGCIGKWRESDEPSNRFDPENRWPCVLAEDLGAGFRVIEEGLGGRTTVYATPETQWRCGETYLFPCLCSHRPLDLVVLMLGTNDLHVVRTLTREELPIGITRLIKLVQRCTCDSGVICTPSAGPGST